MAYAATRDANAQQLSSRRQIRGGCASAKARMSAAERREAPTYFHRLSRRPGLFRHRISADTSPPVASVSAVAGSRGAPGTMSSTKAFGSLSAASHRSAQCTGKNAGPPMRGRAATKRCVPATAEDVGTSPDAPMRAPKSEKEGGRSSMLKIAACTTGSDTFLIFCVDALSPTPLTFGQSYLTF
jgi:hypothetical protein